MKSEIYRNILWPTALVLPSLDWIEIFLPLLGLPNVFLEQRHLWQRISTEATNNYEIRRKKLKWSSNQERDLKEVTLTRQMVAESLNELANLLGKEVAKEFEKWLHFHFFNHEVKMAMMYWGRVLRYLYLTEESRNFKNKISPPTVLIPLLPELEDLVKLEPRYKIRQEIRRIAPYVQIEEWEKEYGDVSEDGMKPCFETVLLKEAIDQTLTFKALETISKRLNKKECQQVVDWASNQLKVMDSKRGALNAEKLCGNKYLRVGLPEIERSLVIDSVASNKIEADE